MRSVDLYEDDVRDNDVSRTGIKTRSPFNELHNFHVIENTSLDIMHDLFEGICSYEMCKILLTFILKDKYFSIDYLNSQLKTIVSV